MSVYKFDPELSPHKINQRDMKLIRERDFLDYLHQTEPPEELLHTPESGDVAPVDEGHPASSFPGSLRQDVLPIRGQGVHEAGSREKAIARFVSFSLCFIKEAYLFS